MFLRFEACESLDAVKRSSAPHDKLEHLCSLLWKAKIHTYNGIKKAVTADSKPGRPRWQKTLTIIGFAAFVVIAFSLYNTLHDINRQNHTTSAISELCDGMQAEEVYEVMKRNGITMFPSEGASFQDRPFGILDWFDPSVKVTKFFIAGSDGLWLVKTTDYRFFIDDSKTEEHILEECED